MLKKIPYVLFFISLLIQGLWAESPTLLVYPFDNQGDPGFDWLSQGMTSTAISDLSGVENLKLISQTDRDKAMDELKLYLSGLLDEEKALEVGKWEGADYIFTGTYMVAGERIRANAQILDVERGTVETSVKIDGTMEEIFDFQDRIVLDLMAEAQRLHLGGIAWNQLARETRTVQQEAERPSLSAYELYSRGLALRNENALEALDYYRQALEQDPDYLDALIMAGHLESTEIRNYEVASAYLNRAENLLIRRGETTSGRYLNLVLALSKIHRSLQEEGPAVEYMEKAEALSYLNPYLVYLHQGNFQRELGRYDSALDYYDRADRALEGREGFVYAHASILLNKGISYNNRNSLPLALQTFEEGLEYLEEYHKTDLPLYAEILFNRGNTYKYQNEIDRAIEEYEKAMARYRNLGLENTANFFIFLGNLGGLYGSYKEDWPRTAELLTEAIDRAEASGNTGHKDYATYILMAAYASYLGGENDTAGPLFRKAYEVFTAMDPNHPKAAELLEKAEELGY